MATGTESVSDIINTSFYDGLKCPICLEILQSPKALMCIHTFCEKCIQVDIDTSSRSGRPSWIVCPVCRKRTTPPKNCAPSKWAEHLPTNWSLKSFIERMAQRSEGEEESNQESNDLEECKKIEICPRHSGETVQFYCKDHSSLLCIKCRRLDHRDDCSIVTIDSIAKESTVTKAASEISKTLVKVYQKLDKTVDVMIKDIEKIGNTVDNFQSHLLKLRNEIDSLMNEMQFDLASSEFRDSTKSKCTSYQNNTISECHSLQEAIRFSESELDVIKKYGTPVQRFIAVERLRVLIPMFDRAADDNARSAMRTEIRHMGIEILDSIMRMKDEMKMIQGVRVKLTNID